MSNRPSAPASTSRTTSLIPWCGRSRCPESTSSLPTTWVSARPSNADGGTGIGHSPPCPPNPGRLPCLAPSPMEGPDAGQVRLRFPHRGQRIDARLAAETGIHVNPWTHFPRLITSIDFLNGNGPCGCSRKRCPLKANLFILAATTFWSWTRPTTAPLRPWKIRHRFDAHPSPTAAGPAL